MTVAILPRSFLVRRTSKSSLTRFAVRRHKPISQLRSKILWMGKWRLKMKLRQYSGDRIEARQVHLAALPLGELRPQKECPVVELLADHLWTESVSRCLQHRYILHGEEGIVVLTKADVGPLQLLLDERVAVEPVGGMNRKEAGHTQDDGPQNFIPNVEVVMGETAALVRQDAVVGVLGGILRNGDAKRPALFHALEEEVN